MEPTNVPRIKRHFGKRSFGNSIFPAHWGGKKKKAQKYLKRGEKTASTKTGQLLTTTEESTFKLAQLSK